MVARGAISLLKKAGCDHAKLVIQPDFETTSDDTKPPSTEVVELGKKFYSHVWLASGKQMADEAVIDDDGNVPFDFYSYSFGSLYSLLTYIIYFFRFTGQPRQLEKPYGWKNS